MSNNMNNIDSHFVKSMICSAIEHMSRSPIYHSVSVDVIRLASQRPDGKSVLSKLVRDGKFKPCDFIWICKDTRINGKRVVKWIGLAHPPKKQLLVVDHRELGYVSYLKRIGYTIKIESKGISIDEEKILNGNGIF